MNRGIRDGFSRAPPTIYEPAGGAVWRGRVLEKRRSEREKEEFRKFRKEYSGRRRWEGGGSWRVIG